MKIHSVGIIFKALLLVLTALTWDGVDAQFSYWTGYCRVHQSDDDGSSGDYSMTSVITVPLVAAVMIIAITNAQTLAMEDMEDILVVRVLRLAMENARFGRSVLTMVPVVLILIVTATTIHTAGCTIRENMNRSVGVAILLVMVENIAVTIAMTVGKELFQRLPCW